MSTSYAIYTGKWTDQTTGRWVITLSGKSSNVLQAAIPTFVGIVAPYFWFVVKTMWYHISYRLHSATNGRSAFFNRQRQVFLKNSTADIPTLWKAIKMGWSWRQIDHPYSLLRSSPIAFLAIITFVGWIAAGIFTSRIWSNNGNALIRSSTCGQISLQVGNITQENLFRLEGSTQTNAAGVYVQHCYSDITKGSAQCHIFPNQMISYQTQDTACPFATAEICNFTNAVPYQLDTQDVNSHTDLGINAPLGDRVTYRKITTCSPVHSTMFAQLVYANETDEAGIWPDDTLLYKFFYGPKNGADGQAVTDYTFEYSWWTPLDGGIYDITSLTYTPGKNNTNSWIPNSTFTARTDGETSIFFLTGNHVVYSAPVLDPIFATGESYNQTDSGETYTLWKSKYFVNVLACMDQHRICNPALNETAGCTPFLAYSDLVDAIFDISMNVMQLATTRRIILNLQATNTYNSVSGRRSAALLATQTVSELLQTKLLPDNQWRLEVENWFEMSLAKLQQGIVSYASGPADPSLVPYVIEPTDREGKALCHTQLVPLPSTYTNFSLRGIIIVAVIGTFIIILGLSIETIMNAILKRTAPAQRLQWISDGPFQLQRLAYEASGTKDWQRADHEFPTTKLTTISPLIVVNHQPVLENIAAHSPQLNANVAPKPTGLPPTVNASAGAANTGPQSLNVPQHNRPASQPRQPSTNSNTPLLSGHLNPVASSRDSMDQDSGPAAGSTGHTQSRQ